MRLGLSTLARTFFFALPLLLLLSSEGEAQGWNDSASTALVREATSRRALQLADTGLVDYSARAKGFVTFLAQFGEGFTEPPKIVRADELALEIFWRAPNLSKQRVYAMRDTLVLPTDIQYHRDHLGIVQNNFPSIIRLGDGDEVRDVPHPLSAAGLEEYDFAIRDSVEIRLGPRTLYVYEVRVKPRNALLPRAVGAVFIDTESHDVVRMAFSFTRSALKDKDLDDVSVVLENGLFEGRFWLPRRQEIEIRRSGTWLDFPARGIIRGRWEICCYEVNKGLDAAMFTGPEIVISQSAYGNSEPFTGKILDSLPSDVRAVSDDDVKKVQDEARALVREQALARTRRVGLAGRAISDFVRFNRVEGVAAGAGMLSRLGGGVSVPLYVSYGFSDRQWKGSGGLAFERASGTGIGVSLFREYRDVSGVAERSRLVNSLAAQEFGSDYTDPYDVRGARLRVKGMSIGGTIPAFEFALEEQRSLDIHARSTFGAFEPTVLAANIDQVRAKFSLDRPNRIGALGFEIRAHGAFEYAAWESRSCCVEEPSGKVRRGAVTLQMEKPFGINRLVLQTYAGTVRGTTGIPTQHLFFFGGPVTAPGYDFHSLAGTSALSQRVEVRFPVSFPSFPLGRYGRSPSSAQLAPFITASGISGSQPIRANDTARPDGWYPSLGIGLLPVFELLRFDVARGLRNGRWTFSFDLSRDFWGIL